MEIEKCFEQNEDNSTFSVAAIQCTQSQLFSFDSRSLFTRICRMNIFILDNASAHHSTSGCLIRSECKSIQSIQNAICSLGRTALCICEYACRCVGGCVCLCTRVCVCVYVAVYYLSILAGHQKSYKFLYVCCEECLSQAYCSTFCPAHILERIDVSCSILCKTEICSISSSIQAYNTSQIYQNKIKICTEMKENNLLDILKELDVLLSIEQSVFNHILSSIKSTPEYFGRMTYYLHCVLVRMGRACVCMHKLCYVPWYTVTVHGCRRSYG